MIEPTTVATAELEALVSMLSRVGSVEGVEGDAGGSDAVRVDQLAVLERVKAAAAAAQARVTAAFVDSQQQVAQAWRERARECSAVGDFDGWRAAREQARAASFTDDEDRAGSVDPSCSGGSSVAGGRSDGSRRRRRASGVSGVAGVAAQVALARRESPVQGAGHVRLAVALTRDLPHTLAALTAGDLSEWRAQIIVRETATLTAQQRALVDAEVIGRCRATVAGWGDRELARQVRAAAYRIDAGSVLARAAKAETERRVTLRPAPDTMAYLTALLPVAQAVAVHAALVAAADTARATGATDPTGAAGPAGAAGVAGDGRGKGQVMADTLVTRVTGQASAGAVPVEVQLVMTDRALLAGDGAPAQLTGYGTIPAAHARALLTPPATSHADRGADADSEGDASAEAGARVWLRRLYTHPVTGALVGMDSHRRTFDGGLRRYLLTRDAGTCRTPWCDAPARHLDHVHDHADGGPTTASNAQGLCVRCNLVKQLPGFHAATRTPDPSQQPGTPRTVVTTTPTGHTYTSHAPPLLPGLPPALADHDVGHPDADPDAGDPCAIETDANMPDVEKPHAAESPAAERDPVRVDLEDLEHFSPFERLIAIALAAA